MAKKEIATHTGMEKVVDRAFLVEQEIEALKGEQKILEDQIKESGACSVQGFGSVNVVGGKAPAVAQVTVKRPTASVTDADELEKVLGESFPLFFDVSVSTEKEVRKDRIPDLEQVLIKAGKNPADFFSYRRTVRAKDSWVDVASRDTILKMNFKGKAAKVLEAAAKFIVQGQIVKSLRWIVKK